MSIRFIDPMTGNHVWPSTLSKFDRRQFGEKLKAVAGLKAFTQRGSAELAAVNRKGG